MNEHFGAVFNAVGERARRLLHTALKCKIVIRLYRKCSGGLSRSIGCAPPRWISNNDYYRKSSGVSRIRLICKACRSISDKVQ
ncbi:MAG: hypothetical protein BECKG1743D_GA0114223_105043 [Candidatus Kentron sp. G]|nr:MAG: hypothetical protein BECKG1743D_GA0114223_105043 [Candidatus Kentron sp. G]